MEALSSLQPSSASLTGRSVSLRARPARGVPLLVVAKVNSKESMGGSWICA